MMRTSSIIIKFIFSLGFTAANVFTGSAIFERLAHFKNDGVVNHLNTVDLAMIADGSCRMANPSIDGFALWHNKEATDSVINVLREVLPETSKPSYFVLSALEVLAEVCPVEEAENNLDLQEDFTCRGGGYEAEVMAGAMHNWQRALCAPEDESEWGGEYDPAYQPQQVALTSGFMCIIACDCNGASIAPDTFWNFAESTEAAETINDLICGTTAWGDVDFADAAADVDLLARMSAPLMFICGCASS